MAQQSYSNHRKYYTVHHFIFYPVTLGLVILSIYFADKNPDRKAEWFMLAAIIFLIAWLSFMVRQHYAMIPQNRIIRLEMRLRYFELYGKKFDPVEAKLKFRQIAALRFASDEELPALLERSVEEKLSPRSIKKLITDWQGDHMRV
ncbi:MAG TPA: DUF6526 family protein [Flavitalea sp.]|nr:DUF6526 family protein [Flavitalea sp.]